MEKTKEQLREEKALKKLQRPWFKKKRIWFSGIILLFIILFFSACGMFFGAVSDEIDQSTSTTEKAVSNGSKDEGSAEEVVAEKNIVVVDDAVAKITITGFVTKKDAIFGDSADLKVEIVNKSDKTLEVSTSEISVDGMMADDLVVFYETVAPGKTAKGTVSFEDWLTEEGEDIPAFKENIEGNFLVMDGTSYERISESAFNVKLK